MNSDDENNNDNFNEDQIINLISALQQKIKSSRQYPDRSNYTQENEFSLKNSLKNNEQSKHSSISDNLSDIVVKTDKLNKEYTGKNSDYLEQSNKLYQQDIRINNDDINEIKMKLDYIIQEREQDRAIIQQLNTNMLQLMDQLIKKDKQIEMLINNRKNEKDPPQYQYQQQHQQQQQQQLYQKKENASPISNVKRKTAQQTIQQMFNDPDRQAFDEIRNFCFKRG